MNIFFLKSLFAKLVLIFLVHVMSLGVIRSQSNNYIAYYNNIERAYQVGVFNKNNDSTIFYIEKAKEAADPLPEDLFILSNAYSNKGMQDDAFNALLRSIRTGLDSTMLDQVFSADILTTNQKEDCIIEYKNFSKHIDTSLYWQLDSIIRLDQLARNELFKHSRGEAIFDSLEVEMFKQDSLNRCWLMKTVKERGWPGRKLIGNDRKSFTLLLHIKQSWIDNNFKLLKQQIIDGYLNPSYLAASIDRYNFRKNGIIYGSYLPGNTPFNANEEMKEKRTEIGALSTKVFFEREKIVIREWKPKNSKRVGNK